MGVKDFHRLGGFEPKNSHEKERSCTFCGPAPQCVQASSTNTNKHHFNSIIIIIAAPLPRRREYVAHKPETLQWEKKHLPNIRTLDCSMPLESCLQFSHRTHRSHNSRPNAAKSELNATQQQHTKFDPKAPTEGRHDRGRRITSAARLRSFDLPFLQTVGAPLAYAGEIFAAFSDDSNTPGLCNRTGPQICDRKKNGG